VLDLSGSIGPANVQQMIRFLQLMINSLNVDADDSDPTVSRIGLAIFADSASAEFQLNTYSKQTELLQVVYVQYEGGTTNTSDAIRYTTVITGYNGHHITNASTSKTKMGQYSQTVYISKLSVYSQTVYISKLSDCPVFVFDVNAVTIN